MGISVETNEKGLVKRIAKSDKSSWLDSPQKLPDVFLPLVLNYTKGQAISKDIEVIPISGQKWGELTQGEKEQLLELVEYTGVRAEDYCRHWESMLPKDPVRRR